MNQRRRLLLVVISTAVLIWAPRPVTATHTSEHAIEQVSAIVTEAEADMDRVVSGFADQIEGLTEEGPVDAAADASSAEVEEIWTTARSAIDNLMSLYPGPLGKPGAAAMQELQQARQTARATISDLTDDWVPPVPAPSSTTTTTTTTTTVPDNGAEDPGDESGPNPAQGPPSDPGNGVRPTPDTGQVTNPSNEKDPKPDKGPPTGEESGRVPGLAPTPPSDTPVEETTAETADTPDISFALAASTPEQPFTVSPEAINTLLAAEDTGATAGMAAMLETVLSPAVVELVLSPLLVLEILLGTLVDGGSRLIGPLALLTVFALGIFGYDRASKRSLFLDKV